MPLENVSTDLRHKVLQNFGRYVIGDGPGFGKRIGDRIQVKELLFSLENLEAITVCEMVVMEDMLDVAEDSLHPSCSAYLIDMCTALPFILLALAQEKHRNDVGPPKFSMAPFAPSQRLDITYYRAAHLGAHLKIIGKSLTHDGSLLSVCAEIWDMTEGQLVAFATHCKVMPKKPPPAASGKL